MKWKSDLEKINNNRNHFCVEEELKCISTFLASVQTSKHKKNQIT